MRSAICRCFVIDGIPTNAKDFKECTSYLAHLPPTPRNAASHWTHSFPSIFCVDFQVLLATVSANDMKYLFGALLDILVIWPLYPLTISRLRRREYRRMIIRENKSIDQFPTPKHKKIWLPFWKLLAFNVIITARWLKRDKAKLLGNHNAVFSIITNVIIPKSVNSNL